jgi:hypothetical protein
VSALLVLAAGLAMLALPGAQAWAGDRLPPAGWARATQACLRAGRALAYLALVVAAAPGALVLVGARSTAHACHRLVAAGLPAPAPASVAARAVAAAALVALVGRSVAARRRARTGLRLARAEPWLGHHHLRDGVDVVTLPCDEHLAYAVPGRPGQVVLSTGLVRALDRDEVEAVLRHERAHLRHGHHRELGVAADVEACFGWFPPARRSAATLRLAVERWADEEAAGGCPQRRPAMRRALVKVVTGAGVPAPPFADVGTVVARLDALAERPPRAGLPARLVATGPMVAVAVAPVVVAAACAALADRRLGALVEHCVEHL